LSHKHSNSHKPDFLTVIEAGNEVFGLTKPTSAPATEIKTQKSKLKTFSLPPLVKKPSPSDTGLGEFIDPTEKVP
jgi:hypothetical protein